MFTTSQNERLFDINEFSLPRNASYLAGTPMATLVTVQLELDITAIVSGDEFELSVYDTVNGTYKRVHRVYLTSLNAHGTFVLDTRVYGPNWDITIKKIAGTDRLLRWKLTVGSVDSTATVVDAVWDEGTAGHVAAGSFGALLQALPSVAQIRDAVFAFVFEGAKTFVEFVRDANAVLAEDAADLTTAPKYKDSTGADRVSFTSGGGGTTRTRS